MGEKRLFLHTTHILFNVQRAKRLWIVLKNTPSLGGNYQQKCVVVYVTFEAGEGGCCSLSTIGQVERMG